MAFCEVVGVFTTKHSTVMRKVHDTRPIHDTKKAKQTTKEKRKTKLPWNKTTWKQNYLETKLPGFTCLRRHSAMKRALKAYTTGSTTFNRMSCMHLQAGGMRDCLCGLLCNVLSLHFGNADQVNTTWKDAARSTCNHCPGTCLHNTITSRLNEQPHHTMTSTIHDLVAVIHFRCHMMSTNRQQPCLQYVRIIDCSQVWSEGRSQQFVTQCTTEDNCDSTCFMTFSRAENI